MGARHSPDKGAGRRAECVGQPRRTATADPRTASCAQDGQPPCI
eukprot:gene53018-12631_t